MDKQSGEQSDSLIGQLIQGRYRVGQKLGQGGMGRVYQAEQVSLKRPIALKVLLGEDKQSVARFQREAERAAKLNHLRIVTIYDFGRLDEGGFFIAMEHVPGPTLKDLLKSERLTVPRALQLGMQIAEGLQVAHQAGIIHRDVKPANIIVQAGDQIKLLDFGIARAQDSQTHLTQSGQVFGTPKYMAPEQWGVGTVSEQTDLYALGIVLYEMLSGRAPFSASAPPSLMRMHLEEPPPPLRSLRPGIPPSVERLVLRALEKQPEQRQRNMAELIGELQAALESRDEKTEASKPDPLVGQVIQGRYRVERPLNKSDSGQAPPAVPVEVSIAPQSLPESSSKPQPSSPPPAHAAQTNKRRRSVGWLGAVAGIGLVGLLTFRLIPTPEITLHPQAVQEAKARARKAAEEQKAAEAAQQRQQEAQRQAEAERQRQEREAAEAERKRLDAEQRRQAEVARQRQSGMVSVPAGRFWMGCNEEVDTECWDAEKPGRTVEVAAFQIDKTEVTVAAYRACVSAGKCSPPDTGAACAWDQSGKEQHPVNCVDWAQAQAYCAWAGKRLPTEAEWEKAARGTDRRKYPWGDQGYKTAGRVANIADETSGLDWKVDGYDDGYSQTAPVGSFPTGASPYGALDMVGNVWEWTADWYDSGGRSVRGGAWHSVPWLARASDRDRYTPAYRYVSLGFGCAQ